MLQGACSSAKKELWSCYKGCATVLRGEWSCGGVQMNPEGVRGGMLVLRRGVCSGAAEEDVHGDVGKERLVVLQIINRVGPRSLCNDVGAVRTCG
jgi:hypothetical protein